MPGCPSRRRPLSGFLSTAAIPWVRLRWSTDRSYPKSVLLNLVLASWAPTVQEDLASCIIQGLHICYICCYLE